MKMSRRRSECCTGGTEYDGTSDKAAYGVDSGVDNFQLKQDGWLLEITRLDDERSPGEIGLQQVLSDD
jgi:hypothetical protein